jgi:hypothetical protein
MLLAVPSWSGRPLKDTYGGKGLVNCEGSPVFVEIAIISVLKAHGFNGAVWVDSYRRCFRDAMPPAICTLPTQARAVYERIATINGGRRGCWVSSDSYPYEIRRHLLLRGCRMVGGGAALGGSRASSAPRRGPSDGPDHRLGAPAVGGAPACPHPTPGLRPSHGRGRRQAPAPARLPPRAAPPPTMRHPRNSRCRLIS